MNMYQLIPMKFLTIGLSILLTAEQVYSDYSGTHVSCAGDTISAGQALSYDVTVQNTGSSTWYGGSNPAWVHRVFSSDCSWSPKPSWSYTTDYHWSSVSGGSTPTVAATFSADDLPTAPGTYSFWVYAYYPTDMYGNYSLMTDSPQQVTFTISGSSNSDPTDITISSSSVDENQPTGTVVGALSTTDPDAGDTHTYALVSGSGDDDNASFSLDGSNLLTAVSFNYESKSNYTIRIRATDQGSLFYEETVPVAILDVSEPPPNVGLMASGGTDTVLQWSSIHNHTYQLLVSTNLSAGFSVHQAGIPATPPMNSYTVSLNGASCRFWKITTEE